MTQADLSTIPRVRFQKGSALPIVASQYAGMHCDKKSFGVLGTGWHRFHMCWKELKE